MNRIQQTLLRRYKGLDIDNFNTIGDLLHKLPKKDLSLHPLNIAT
jgi:hypothetical protein